MPLIAKCVSISLFAVLFVSAADAATPQQTKASVNNTSTMMQMPIAAPLFIEDQDFSSTLVLVNGGAVQTYADVTVRAPDGRTLVTKRVQFQPHSQKQVTLHSLLKTSGNLATGRGSITVMQSPDLTGMVITAALSITRLTASQPNYIDEELAMPSEESSQVLRAVADNSDGPPIVALTSLSSRAQRVQIQCLEKDGVKFSKSVELLAGESLFTPACLNDRDADLRNDAEGLRKEQHGAVGIALQSDGMPGSYAAFALAPHRLEGSRIFSSVAFNDPKMIMSSTIVFAGVPVGTAFSLPSARYTPTLALANFSARPARVTVRFAQTTATTPQTRDVENIVVPPLCSRSVSFEDLEGDPNLQNSFLVIADGSPGDVQAKLVSKSDSLLREVELLAKDLKDPQNGGNHPWSIEGGNKSTLLLFNTSNTSQYFNVAISAGTAVWRTAYKLKSMETKAVRIGELIEDKAKDDKGLILPKEVSAGQIEWHVPAANAGRGRLLQSNPETAMARNFSCGVVAELCEVDFSGIDHILQGQTVNFGQMSTQVCANTCSGTPIGPGGSGYTYAWSSENANIASIPGSNSDPSVNVFGASEGHTFVDGSASDSFCLQRIAPAPPATVQKPKSLSAPTLTNVMTQTSGPVLDYYGQTVISTSECGVVRYAISDLLDGSGNKIITSSNFTLTEMFSGYSTTVPGLTVPPTQSSEQNTSIQRPADTQFFGTRAPTCPGSNDNETFNQSFSVTINGVTYPLTTVRKISRGWFNGTPNITVTTTTN